MDHLKEIVKYLPRLGGSGLKELIKGIRGSKTAADERAVVQRESALIRTSLREDSSLRYINIQKLLYIHMLGYPSHFGQIECLKLLASPKFSDKRLAHLGISLLIDENHETLTLVTNCIKNDLNNSNMFIVALALCSLANIASTEMSRDLASDVERLLSSSNSYIRKKAALCALRIIKKVPDLIDNFIEKAISLLDERNHGVLLTGVTLLSEMASLSPSATSKIRQNVPVLVRHLKSLVTAGTSPEHDVNGISDPFLQVKILRLLRILGKNNPQASEAMNDVLAQVATTTEASKNVGNAILYETVLTIMNIDSESSLRVLGINILGRFLSNRDNNIKYVALTTLTKTSQTAAATDASALQRHRSTVLDCLRDPDISIRRRALDLAFYLINPSNIRILTRELLSFLETAESEIKSSVATRICDYAGRFRPNKRWEIDTVTRVLRVSGAYVDQSVINHFIKLVSTGDPIVHQYSTRKLYHIIVTEGDQAWIQEGLLQAAFWCIGEYGDVLIAPTITAPGFGIDEDHIDTNTDTTSIPTDHDVFNLYTTILRGPYATLDVKQYAITSLMKLGTRFQSPTLRDQIKSLLIKYRVNMDVEIQQRAVEYTELFGVDETVRSAVVERMPVLESAVVEESVKGTGSNTTQSGSGNVGGVVTSTSPDAGDLLGSDLAGLALGGPSTNVPGTGSTGTTQVLDLVFGHTQSSTLSQPKQDNIMDLLGGIGLGTTSTGVGTTNAIQSKQHDLLGDLFGSTVNQPSTTLPTTTSITSTTPSSTSTLPPYTLYTKNNLRIVISPVRDTPTRITLTTTFTHMGSVGTPSIRDMSYQLSVPKSHKLVMQPMTRTMIDAGDVNGDVIQICYVDGVVKGGVRIRIRVGYRMDGVGGDGVIEMLEVSGVDW